MPISLRSRRLSLKTWWAHSGVKKHKELSRMCTAGVPLGEHCSVALFWTLSLHLFLFQIRSCSFDLFVHLPNTSLSQSRLTGGLAGFSTQLPQNKSTPSGWQREKEKRMKDGMREQEQASVWSGQWRWDQESNPWGCRLFWGYHFPPRLIPAAIPLVLWENIKDLYHWALSLAVTCYSGVESFVKPVWAGRPN